MNLWDLLEAAQYDQDFSIYVTNAYDQNVPVSRGKVPQCVLADSYEKQANDQGYTFGENTKWIQHLGNGIIFARGHGCITDAEYDRILRRFHNKILVKNIKPLKEGGSNDAN